MTTDQPLITEAMIEAAARALARKIELNEGKWFQYSHAAELALRAAFDAK